MTIALCNCRDRPRSVTTASAPVINLTIIIASQRGGQWRQILGRRPVSGSCNACSRQRTTASVRICARQGLSTQQHHLVTYVHPTHLRRFRGGSDSVRVIRVHVIGSTAHLPPTTATTTVTTTTTALRLHRPGLLARGCSRARSCVAAVPRPWLHLRCQFRASAAFPGEVGRSVECVTGTRAHPFNAWQLLIRGVVIMRFASNTSAPGLSATSSPCVIGPDATAFALSKFTYCM